MTSQTPTGSHAVAVRRTSSIRSTLAFLAAGLLVYVLAIASFLALRIAPRAAAVQAQDQRVLLAYDEMHSRADVLSRAVRDLAPVLLREATGAPHRRDTTGALEAGVTAALDSLDIVGSVAIAGGSIELRTALARSVEAEFELASSIRRSLAAARLGRPTEALAWLDSAQRLEIVTRDRLSATERVALGDLVLRERELSDAAMTGVRAIAGWVVIGILLVLWWAITLQRRLYAPLAALDAGMLGVAEGTLDARVPVLRDDELGRVSRQFNEMTEVLRQRAEDERRRATIAERQRIDAERARIFNLSVDFLAVANMEGRILQVNPAVQRILGFAPEDMVGRSFFDYAHPDDVETALAEISVLASGRPVHGFRVRFLRTDGAYRWISWSANPPEDGVFYAVGRDITDEKVAEDHQLRLQMELERSAREWRQTFDAIDNSILILDRFGAVTRLNAAARKLTGRSYDDVLGRTLSMLGNEEPWIGASEAVADVTSQGSALWRQVRNLATGRAFDVDVSPVPGVERRTILVIRDVTPLVQLQESLRRSETMSAMGQLVAGVAHEVRNPLFSMTATLDAFEARGGVRNEDQRHLGVMRNQLTRLTHLMEDLLEYGKPPSLQLAPQLIDPIITQAAEAVAVLADDQGVLVIREIAPGLPAVTADRLRMVQVFANLLSNSIQHSRERAVILVRACVVNDDAGEWVECSVLDHGPGFTPEDLPHIFEPFYTRRRGGTGLGLALVHRIVEQHGGTVVAGNRPEGGASMKVRLRCAPGLD